jgi:hypothetical protein
MRGPLTLSASGLFFASIAACGNAQSNDHSANGAPDSSTSTDARADSSVDSGGGGGDASDGGVTDSGVTDSGVTDSAADNYIPLGDGGPSLCTDGGAFLFCDGFEDTKLSDNWTQPIYGNAPPPQSDSVHYYRGTHALHARTYAAVDAGVATYSMIHKIASSGTWGSHFFTRFFVYQPSPDPPAPETVLDLVGASDPYAGMSLVSNPSGGFAAFTFNTSMDHGWTSDAGGLPLDQWVCFEVEVDTFNSVWHMYMSDVEITALAGSNLGLSSLGNVIVGMGFYSPVAGQAQNDAWIDEVAVSTSRIGCSN